MYVTLEEGRTAIGTKWPKTPYAEWDDVFKVEYQRLYGTEARKTKKAGSTNDKITALMTALEAVNMTNEQRKIVTDLVSQLNTTSAPVKSSRLTRIFGTEEVAKGTSIDVPTNEYQLKGIKEDMWYLQRSGHHIVMENGKITYNGK